MEFVRARYGSQGGTVCVVNVTHCMQVCNICSINEILGQTFLVKNLKDSLTYKDDCTELEKEDLVEFSKIMTNLAQS